MKIQIQAIQFNADRKLISFIERKIAKLEQFFGNIISAEVYLSLGNKSSHIKDKVAKVKVFIPGNQLVASNESKLFEEAVDQSIEALKRQLVRYKEKKHKS